MDNSLSWSDTKEPHLSRMIRTDDWKFIYYHGYNNQLFNLKNDPDEMQNLSGLKEYSKIETKLNEKILKDWKPQMKPLTLWLLLQKRWGKYLLKQMMFLALLLIEF